MSLFLNLNYSPLFFLFFLSSFLSGESLADGIVAVVKNYSILQSEVLENAQMQLIQSGKSSFSSQNELDFYLERSLENIINQRVFFESAKLDTEMVVTNEDVDLYLDNHLNNLIAQHGSKEAIEAALKKPLKVFRRESWDEVYKLILSERFQQKLILDIDISRKEVELFFNEYKDSIPTVPAASRFSLIDIPIVPSNEAELSVVSFLNSIRDSIKNNSNTFENYARLYSDDVGSAVQGGALGFFERGTLVPEYEKRAFSLSLNEISNPVKSSFGYHLIQLLERRGDKINTRHILKKVVPNNLDSLRALNEARSIYSLLEKNSIVFDSIALNFKNKNYGQSNVFGWTYNSNINDVFLKQIHFLEHGNFSFPFKSDNGFMILFLHEKELSKKPSLNNSYSLIKDMALQKKMATSMERWLNVTKKEIYIKYYN